MEKGGEPQKMGEKNVSELPHTPGYKKKPSKGKIP